MVNREFISRFLELNGVSEGASEDEIKTVLKEAHWGDEEIRSAIEILHSTPKHEVKREKSPAQEGKARQKTHERKDDVVSSAKVTVDLDPKTINAESRWKHMRTGILHFLFGLFIVPVVLGILVGLLFFGAHKLGIEPMSSIVEELMQ